MVLSQRELTDVIGSSFSLTSLVYSVVDFQITMHLSPHEQKIIIPWLKTFPKKVVDRFPLYLWPISTLAFVYATMAWTEAEDYMEDYAHRF